MKTLASLAAAVFLITTASGYVDLVSLGTSTFTVEPSATTALYSQNASGIVFNGSYVLGNTLGGTFTLSDWSSPSLTEFGMVMSINGVNPNLPFAVEFYDGSFNVINKYEGFTVGAGSTPTYIPMTLLQPGTGNLTQVAGIQFTWNGDGAIDATVQSVAAVPEPSTYALLALGAALGGYVLRRHRRA